MTAIGTTMYDLNKAMTAAGLFERGPQQTYWYGVWDGLVAELAPSMADDVEEREQ